MNTTIKKLSDSQIEIGFELSFQEFEQYFPRAARDLSRDLNIPGFRKGSAPLEVVRNFTSEFSIMEKAVPYAVQDLYTKTIQKENLEVIGSPSIEIMKLALQNPLQFRATVPVFPKIDLPGDWKKISRDICKKRVTSKVSEEEIKEALLHLTRSRRTFHEVDRPCEKGDRVEVSFEAFENNIPLPEASSKNHPLIIGEGRFLPGFEDELIGLKKGTVKEFTLEVPVDWWQQGLSGKTITFRIDVRDVRKVHNVDLNDDFVKTLGNFETVEDLRANVKEGIREEKEAKEKERIRAQILEEIGKRMKFEIPESIVTKESERLFKELRTTIEGMGLKIDEYFSSAKKTEKEIRDEFRQEAKKRVVTGFILKTIAREENVEVSEDELEERVKRELLRLRSPQGRQKEIDQEEFREYTKNVLRSEKTFELLENC